MEMIVRGKNIFGVPHDNDKFWTGRLVLEWPAEKAGRKMCLDKTRFGKCLDGFQSTTFSG